MNGIRLLLNFILRKLIIIAHGRSTKQLIHALERPSLCLGHAEVGPNGHQDGARPEEKIRSVSDVGDHVRGRASDDELEEPLRGGGEGAAKRSDSEREDFGAIDPDDTVPRSTVKDDEDVDHGDGDVASSLRVCVVCAGLGDGDIGSDIEHGEGSTSTTDDEELAAAETVKEEDEGDNRGAHLDDTIDTGGEEGGRSAGDTEGFEDGGRVVVDSVDSGQVLAHHHAHADSETIANTLHSEFLELTKERGSVSHFRFVLELSAHLVDFVGDVFVVGGKLANPAEIIDTLLPSTLLGQPTRSLLGEEHAEEKDTAGDELKSKGDHPLLSGGGEIAVDTVGDPEAKDGADLEHDLEESNHSASDGGRGNFADVDGDNQTGGADGPASDESSDVDGGKVSKGKELNEGTGFKDCGADHQSEASSDFFGEREDHECAEEATALETRDDVGRVKVDRSGALAGETKVIFEGGQGNGAADKLFIRCNSSNKLIPLCHNRIRPSQNS